MDEFSLGTLILALVVILICSGFFSSSETSMMALNRHRLNHLVRLGNKRAKLTARLLVQTDKLLGSILFGNTLLNVAAATLTEIIVLRLFEDDPSVALLVGSLLITFVILVFSEIMPKIIAASHPERVALFSSYPLAVFIKLFHPVVSVATAIVQYVLWLLRIKVQTDQSKHKMSMEELRMLVLESEQFLPRKHQGMLLNLVDIGRVAVNDVMVPRNQIEALDLTADPGILREQLATCHHTLLPVYEGALDNMVGILHVRRALTLMREDFSCDELRELLLEPYFIPSDTTLLSQLQYFQERQIRLGLVVDEYGELLGLVTLENILEEIVGDFTTQSPAQTGKFLRQDDGSLLVEGGTPLRDLNRKLGMHFPLDGAKTLNGLILDHLQNIPETGTSLKVADYPIEIIQTQDRVVKVAKIFPALRKKAGI
ncbi:MAG: HlyC/CorC family transporter [Nitrosomonadales bacterium]|nr:HlyC/CorC family transporter [Nitrosomonadales bacterium]